MATKLSKFSSVFTAILLGLSVWGCSPTPPSDAPAPVTNREVGPLFIEFDARVGTDWLYIGMPVKVNNDTLVVQAGQVEIDSLMFTDLEGVKHSIPVDWTVNFAIPGSKVHWEYDAPVGTFKKVELVGFTPNRELFTFNKNGQPWKLNSTRQQRFSFVFDESFEISPRRQAAVHFVIKLHELLPLVYNKPSPVFLDRSTLDTGLELFHVHQ